MHLAKPRNVGGKANKTLHRQADGQIQNKRIMKIVFIIIGLIVLAIAVFAVYRLVTVKRQNNKLNAERFDRVKELYDKLESGQEITENDVLPFAKNILTRQTAFQLLSDHDKTNLFPNEFNNLISDP